MIWVLTNTGRAVIPMSVANSSRTTACQPFLPIQCQFLAVRSTYESAQQGELLIGNPPLPLLGQI